jgi:hypothetical protein
MKKKGEIGLDFSRLEQNICDVIKEQQIKLGYRKEVIRLYYPLSSLNRFLKTEATIEKMQEALTEFCRLNKDRLGEMKISNQGDRFCFCLPCEASEYVHTHTEQDGFLYDFIGMVSRHGVSIEEIIALFKRYSNCVCVEKMTQGEFDYLLYFEDGKPDSFRYCLTDEGGHVIYHRFTIEDYEDSFGG